MSLLVTRVATAESLVFPFSRCMVFSCWSPDDQNCQFCYYHEVQDLCTIRWTWYVVMWWHHSNTWCDCPYYRNLGQYLYSKIAHLSGIDCMGYLYSNYGVFYNEVFKTTYSVLKLKLPLKVQKGLIPSGKNNQSLVSFNWKTNGKFYYFSVCKLQLLAS